LSGILSKVLKKLSIKTIAMSRANIQIVHFFDHGYLEEEKSMINSFTVTFGAKYLTGKISN
jgi:hypothetical protein